MTPREESAANLRAALDDLRTGPDLGDLSPANSSTVPRPPAGRPVPVRGEQRTLDWESKHDARSRAYALADRLRQRVPITDHQWAVGPVLDQGTEGACVGFAAAHAANVLERRDYRGTAPHSLADTDDALHLYGRAQELDEVSGEDYEGTSVLAGMKAGVEAGWWDGYGWCFGTRDLAQAVLQVGPVVVGIPWTSGMYETQPNGRILVRGAKVGGHCLAVVGIRTDMGPAATLQDPPSPYFIVQNSWGEDYGLGGLGFIHHADMHRLLSDQGEAAIPLPVGWEPTS